MDELIKLAKRGNAEAMLELGIKYVNGNGVKANYDKGFDLIERAAKKTLCRRNTCWACCTRCELPTTPTI